MMAKRLSIVVLIFCVAGLMLGCPKKQIKKDEPGMKAADSGSAAADVEKEKAARDAAEKARKDREAREAKAKADEDRAKTERDLAGSLTPVKTPGIEGTVEYSTLLKNIYFDFDHYDVRPGDTEILKANAAVLKKYPNVKIQVTPKRRGRRTEGLASSSFRSSRPLRPFLPGGRCRPPETWLLRNPGFIIPGVNPFIAFRTGLVYNYL
jgi:hypothetical protein